MNIFEGSRRIAYVLASIVTICALFFIFTNKPYVHIDYVVNSPSSNPERMTYGDCPENGKLSFFSKKSTSDNEYNVSLCLLPLRFGEDRRFLIPYKVDDEGFWGAEKYSQEVENYEKTLESKFNFSKEDIEWLEKQESHEYWKSIKEGFLGIIIGLAIFFIFVWTIGWIARGFMGIPRGMDKKQKTNV